VTAGGWRLGTVARIVLLVAVAGAGVVAFARQGRPAFASDAQIFVSNSASCTSALTSYVAFVGGPPEDIYLCEKNIDNGGWGAAGVNFDLHYVCWLIGVNAVNLGPAPDYAQGWLDDTGRSVQCLAVSIDPSLETGQGRAYGGCQTVGTNPPFGPSTAHVLAKITVQPGIVKGQTTLNFQGTPGEPTTGTLLVSAYFDAETPMGSQIIPASVPAMTVYIAPCADYTGSGGNPDTYVTISDILFLAGKFGRTSAQPGWDPDWDMNGDNAVGVLDILTGAKQFSRVCPP